jgi:catechol 2,3-dioxygenase-like lactoylglutathione lyase family enzyme
VTHAVSPSPASAVRVITGMHHVALAARQVHRAERFYTAAAGCRPWPQARALMLASDSVPLCSPNAGIVLLQADAAAPPVRRPVNEAGIAHLCLQTPDIAAVVERMTSMGAQLHSEPIDLGTGFLYCYARDPEHNVIEVECVSPVWPDPRPWLAHANIVTHDLARLCAFYGELLGVDPVRSPRLRDDSRLDAIAGLQDVQLRAAWLDAGNAQLELMQYLRPATDRVTGRRTPGGPGFAHLAFEVTSLAAACARLQACGGRLDAAPAPGDWQAWGADPDGNALLLLELQDPARSHLRIEAMADPHITRRFAAARAALSASA